MHATWLEIQLHILTLVPWMPIQCQIARFLISDTRRT